MSLDELYREVILDHYKNPRNKRPLSPADIDLERNNPLCGDEIAVRALVRDGVVEDLAFEGQGCSISQASASMMTEMLRGKPVKEAEEAILTFRSMMAGKADPPEAEIGDLVAFKGVIKYPVRIKCAILAWDTLQEGITGHQGGG